MLNHPNTLIARQGFWPIFSVSMLALLVHYRFGTAVGIWLWLLAAGLIYLFRDPRREVPSTPLAIVAPVDGKVTAVDPVKDPYLQREAVRIRFKGHWWGVFTIRSAMEGKVNNQWFGTVPDGADGAVYGNASIPPFAQWTQSDEGDDLVTTLSPSLAMKGARCYVQCGERVGQGQRCSYIPFGSDAETYVPASSRIEVKPGDEVKAGSSVIATLMR